MTLTDINVESKTSASEHIRVFRVFRGQKKRETDLSDLSEFYDFQCPDNIKEPYNLTAVRLSKLKQPIKEIDCLLSFLRPLSVLRTSFPVRGKRLAQNDLSQTFRLSSLPHHGGRAGVGVLILLADEEHLAILRKCPNLIINLSLELVDVVTDLIHKWLYGIVVCDSLLTLRLNLVGYAT